MSRRSRTYGMFALLFGVVAFFIPIYLADVGADAQWRLQALCSVRPWSCIAAALVADSQGFRAFVGWMTLDRRCGTSCSSARARRWVSTSAALTGVRRSHPGSPGWDKNENGRPSGLPFSSPTLYLTRTLGNSMQPKQLLEQIRARVGTPVRRGYVRPVPRDGRG